MMINQNEIKSTALRNLNMYFENINFQSNGKNIKDVPKGVNIGFREIHEYEEDKIFIKLYCRVEKKDKFELNLCLVGSFLVGKDFPTDKLLPNAIAIMFPYLRSQVTLMTTQPNITPVTIPPININSFLKRQEEEFNKNKN
nr:MAG TPA: Protein-export protein secB, Greek key beta sheet.35A [Caudoviricetes sp.]